MISTTPLLPLAAALSLTAGLMLPACQSEEPLRDEPRKISIRLDDGAMTPAQVEAFASNVELRRAREILVDEMRIGDEGVAILARSPHISDVTRMRLRNTGVSNIGLGALANAHALRLEDLALGRDGFDVRGLRVLFQSPVVAGLRSLDLSGHLGSGIGRAIVDSPFAHGLRTLYVDIHDASDDDIHALVTSPRLGRLEHLTLQGCWCPTTLLPLTDARSLPQLRHLNVFGFTLDPAVRRAIESARPGLVVSDPTRETGKPDHGSVLARACRDRDFRIIATGDCPATAPNPQAPNPQAPGRATETAQ